MSWTYHWATGGVETQLPYTQFRHGNCDVGCGPVAWTMLFCWADRQAASGNAYWAARTGLYRENGGRGPNVTAPHFQDAGVENVIKEIHDHCRTWCSFGQGATSPWNMDGAWEYLEGRTGAMGRADWNSAGIARDEIRDRAIDSIVNRATPVVIGTGWLTHYPLAFGYAWQRRTVRRGSLAFTWDEVVTDRYFYVNQGWAQGGNGDWVEASTWFAGQLFP
jgi:hypothetical protein